MRSASLRALAAGGRRQAQRGYLRVIIKAGQAAAKTVPALESLFRAIAPDLSNRGFLTEARALLATAVEHAEAIAPHGATPELVAAATALVEQCSTALEAAVSARSRRVEATAGLKEATADVMDLVIRLDAFNRHRYIDDPEQLAAWVSAKNVLGPGRRQNGSAPGGEEGAAAGGADPNAEVRAA